MFFIKYFPCAQFFFLTFCSILLFADIVRKELWYEAEFSIVNDGRNMNEVVMHAKNLTFAECSFHCVKHLKCKSVNYNDEEQICELCDSNINEDESPIDDKRWKNYGTPTKQHGRYSEWIDGQCSVSCGTGEKIRYRRCNNPTPRYGGDDCKGLYIHTVSCNSNSCPVDGGFGTWSAYGTCSKTCGSGVHSKSRICNNPPPQHGGNDCTKIGSLIKTRTCNMNPCPVDGGFGTWSAYGICSKTCGSGTHSRSRACDTPAPQYGGKDCTSIGKSTETALCNTDLCLSINYRMLTSGLCESVTEQVCKEFANIKGATWVGKKPSSSRPKGCWHFQPSSTNAVFFNTNPNASGSCSDIRQCVCV